jgi:hypothetical protein
MSARPRLTIQRVKPAVVSKPAPVEEQKEDPLISTLSTLSSFVTQECGGVGFRNPVTTDHGVQIDTFRWRWVEMSRDRKKLILIFHLTSAPFSGLGVISSQTAYRGLEEELQPTEKLMSRLLDCAKNLRKCTECTRIMALDEIKDGQCFECHLSKALCTKKVDCSICQDETTRYYTTGCGHTFHYSCIAQFLESVEKKRHVQHEHEMAPVNCPNCRHDLEEEFLRYFGGDDY